MRPAIAVVLAVATVVAFAGCGSAKDARRRDVNRYVDQVNRIEVQEAPAWGRAQVAFQSLGQGRLTAKRLRAVEAAPATIRKLRRRVAAIQPPAPAAALHAALLELIDADARFADEVARFGTYTVAEGRLEASLGADTRTLSKALSRSKLGGAQQRALEAYAARLAVLDRREAALQPPASLATWDTEQRARLHALRSSALGLAHSLARGDRVAVGHALTDLRRAMARPAVTVADRAAVVAYDARLARLNRLAAEVAHLRAVLTREYSS